MSGEKTRASLVVARGLAVQFEGGQEDAVSGVDLDIGPGQGIVLTGGEGSGKTTVLRALLGLVPAKGEVEVLGHPPGAPEALRRIGYGPQGEAFGRRNTPRELTRFLARARGAPAPAGDEALERAGLARSAWRQIVATLDIEEVRRASLACAITAQPKLLVLDGPWELTETIDAIDATRSDGGAVLIATDDPGDFPPFVGPTLKLVNGAPT